MMYWFVIFVCFCAGVHASGNSLKDPFICGPPTCAESVKFKYLTPVIYRYQYKVGVESYFAGSSNNRSTLDVSAEVIVQFYKPCEGLLQLANVILIDQDENYPVERAEKFIHAVSLHDLRFSFHDGIISEICPDETEEDWVLNFKRAILSLFQNSMKRFDIHFNGVEQDIHGTCNVEYAVRGQENTSLILVKTRDLSQCTNRYKYLSILQTVRYNFQSKFQTWPVLKSQSKCRITVDHHIYKAISCRERHLFEPFSGRNSGAMTTVVQDLVLMSETNRTGSDSIQTNDRTWSQIQKRSNIFHSHSPYYGRTNTGEVKSARDVLKLLCLVKPHTDDQPSSVDDNMDSGSVVGLWGRLVRAARKLHHPALAQLLARASALCPAANKHILDALPYVASPGSVELIKNMIVEKQVDSETRHEWLMSMAMIPRPKLEMLKSMLELLQTEKYDKVISFTVSSMVHSYCKHSGKTLQECCEEEIPKQILETFQSIVTEIQDKDILNAPREERDHLAIAMKALGNIGGFGQEFAERLLRIAGDPLLDVRARIAAVDAFRRTPCTDTREFFLELYRHHAVDVEVRVSSYLQVMRCPDLATLRNIFHTLRNEPVNQVATFVWSHLNNLGQSSLPSRVEIQGLLSGNTMPQLEDSPDFRMFSRNYEESVFFDQYNAGGNYEANVIFSPDSYIPRSVSLNLTIDMFGESINLFEMKGRGEGFETYFEGWFGTNGTLNKNKIAEKITDRISKFRFARSANETEDIRAKIDDLGYENNALKHRYPMAELSFRVFGNEISFWSAEGNDEIQKSLQRLDPKLRILEILSGKEISYNKASLFLDTTFSVPTGCGLPLNMNLMGTSYVNTKMAGTVVDKFSRSGNLDFEGKISPSVAVSVAATMSVNADSLAASGIRLSARLYTATAVEAKLAVRGIGLVRLDLSLPRDKQEIFAAKSELLVLHGEEEIPQMGLNKNRIEQNTCSWSAFDKAIGIKVCAAYQFPNMTNLRDAPYFLMSGPAKYIVSLEKADRSARTYSFRYRWDRNATADVLDLSYDTPDSKEKRMFNAHLIFSNTSSLAELTVQSSESTIKAKGQYRNQPYDKSLEAVLNIDGRKQFDTVMSFKRHDIKYGYVWVPHAYWVVNDEKIAELSGTCKVKSKGGVTQWDINADFQTKQLASRLIGYYTVNGPTHSTKLQLDYQFYKNPKQTIKAEGVYSERSMTFRHDVYGELGMEFTAYPVYNFYAILRNVKSQSHYDVGLNVSSSKENKADPSFLFVFQRVDKMTGLKLNTAMSLKRPRPIIMKLDYEQTGPKYSGSALLNFNPRSRPIAISGHVFAPPGTQLYIDAELNVTLPALHPANVRAKIHEKRPNDFQVNAVGMWFTGVDFNIDAVYQDQSKTNMASHRLKVLINSSHFKDVAVDARFTQDNRQVTFIAEGEYDADTYKTLVRYILISEQNFTTYAEVDIGERVYSLNLNADLNNNTDVSMDLHIDQYRDVHVVYQRAVTAHQRRLSASLNWDANRDPSQKIGIDAKLDHKGDWNHAGDVTLHYPGNVVNAEFEFLLKNWYLEWLVRGGWAGGSAAAWRVRAYSRAANQTEYAVHSHLTTPFDGWRDNSLDMMWRYQDNMQSINGSMKWQEDFLAFGLLADYLINTNKFYGEINASVNSTIPTLPKAAAIAKHTVIWKKSADTLLSFQYNEDGLMMINSSWAIDRGQNENNITGRVTLQTPFQGYTKGFLRTAFVLGNKRDIKGVTYLDLEDKVVNIYVNGHMRRITNCMLTVNISSPLPQLAETTARFGFVEADRHLVAMVVTPSTTTGIEVLLKLTSLQDFQIFGHVALPIEYLNRAMITARRATEEVDFRVGWGAMDFGVTGIWHYRSILNFVYVYKLYTPLENFEENGLVLKNVYGNGLDTELSLRLSKHKFGVAILLVDAGKGLVEVIRDRLQKKPSNPDMIVDNFDTSANIVLDTLYYPTITFHAHLMKFVGPDEEDIIEANATLHLPEKPPIVLTDVFILEEYTVMRNTLNLVTPFQAVKELKSVYTVDITIGEKFNVTWVALLYNGTYWHEISYKTFYMNEIGEDDAYRAHLASVAVATPLAVLPALEARVSARLEGALWKLAADLAMPSFSVTSRARLELDDPFVETSGSLNLTSPYLEDYFIKMEFKKDFSDLENVLGGGIQIEQGDQNNYVFADVVWRPPPSRYIRFKARGALVPVLSPAETALLYSEENNQKTLTVDFNSENNFYSLKADQWPSSISVTLSSPHKGLRAMKILGEFEKDDIRGSFVSDTLEYSITGKVINRQPLEMALTLVPKGQGQPISVRVKFTADTTTYGVSAHVAEPVQATAHARADFQQNFTDISFKVDLPKMKAKEIYIKSRVDMYPGLRRVVSVQAATPLQKLSFVKADADFIFGPKTGYLLCKYELPDMKGDGDLKWSFLLQDLFIRALGKQLVKQIHRSIDLDIFFGNDTLPDGLPRTNAGFRMDLDHVWQIGGNASFGLAMDRRMALAVNAILPRPNIDVHSLRVDARAAEASRPLELRALYTTDKTKIRAGVTATVLQGLESFDGNSTITWTSNSAYKNVDNLVSYRWEGNYSKYLDYVLNTPYYVGQPTFSLKGSYQKDLVHHYDVLKGMMYRPGNSQIGELDLRYGGFKHTDGHFNFSTPFHTLPWLKSIFNINNEEETSDNKVDLFWPNKTATINTTHKYQKQEKGFTQTGAISMSIPLNTSHLVNTEYYYLEGDKTSNGNATIDFDNERFVKSSFNQVLSKSERNLDLATMDIEVENVHTPVGIKYIREFDDTGSIDVKQATIFHLHNATKFNVTGKLDVHTYEIGKVIKLTAIQGNRTWKFDNKYEAVDNELKQGSKVTWAEDVWINYDIHVTNLSVADTESQRAVLRVNYPRREFALTGEYSLQDASLDAHAQLLWNVRAENNTAELRARWDSPPVPEGTRHDVKLALSHPSFRKDVTLEGQYVSTPSVMSNLSLELQYSDYENEYLKLKSILTDNSNGPIRDYKFALKCTHPSTSLDLDMVSDVNLHSRWYNLYNYYRFQKTMFYEKLRSNRLLVDLNNNSVNWERQNETYFYKVNGSWELTYPHYRARGVVVRPDANDTMYAELSMRDKAVWAHYNSTDDISYHTIGKIIDTRSARLDAWRNYDDVITVDLASYVRLNHSRLLTSAVVWRPEMFGEAKSQAVYVLKLLYSQINETLVIVKEAPMEAHVALRNIWNDAKPRVRDFLDDLNDMHVIKDDLDEFERFLNESYDNNDFYVKDIVEFTYYVLDEMAIRNHLESLPGFVNDMWGMMGNTSRSIKQSLTFVVDSIKASYSNFLESINKILEADLMELVSEKLESMIMQYDNFIRHLHMKFLEYWEETWVNATTRLSKYWHDLLKSIEPLFFKVVHYTEGFVVTIWKGVMDFFHERTAELTDTPYFNYVSTFGHEMDRIYKDLVNNDIITNIKKYSKKLWNVVWGKIEKYLPFTDEFMQLYNEFKNAWETFLKTPQVEYVRAKYNEAYERLKWWYDYFLIGESCDTVWEILYAKLTDLAKTALQYEEIHRTPKTNFIFDPRKGEILLEQKLPMSWHAFNQTPDFSEVSEYRAVRDTLDQWLTSNRSIWAYYYEIRPYLDLNNVIPPFDGIAIVTAGGTLVTFDKEVITVTQAGTYLLTRAANHDNFTALLDAAEPGRYNVLLLSRSHLISIDLYKQQVTLDRSVPLNLPAAVDGLVVDRQGDTITVEGAAGLAVECHLVFRTCKLQVSGWHYATLGGLLGTYNNEQFDEHNLPDGTSAATDAALARGWAVVQTDMNATVMQTVDETQCAKFFSNKVSPLHPCFSVIDAEPFYHTCVRGGEACALAHAYLELCAHQHVPTHVPDHCMQCTTPQGDTLEEGSFVELQNPPMSVDIVFVVEAQACNRNMRKLKNMDLFVDTFDSKLQENGFSDNRYAVVAYGGRGVYARPRALYVHNELFADPVDIPRHFETIIFEKEQPRNKSSSRGRRSDAAGALRYASTLPFRAGAPRALLLMPCDRCGTGDLDYSTIYHNLMENSITLHILMNEDFTLSKKRVAKYLFGVDSSLAYTNKDYERLVGDSALRKQVRLPKDKLGLCTTLALETNGTIWAGTRLSGERGAARRFASVAGARCAAAAGGGCGAPRCECRAGRLHCRPCAARDPLELSYWNSEDIDELIDMAMDPPNLPNFR
ncbi:uncharacterized protein LOC121728328 [Aricia agestis]|uniref:uncharacterized protein LOC121728328 n=1 Tax=Aricia agestis TaxID=91739 RepID=UPI001C209FBA|nr:uncharacterized protein LOC121728328 [Aricia agestis]